MSAARGHKASRDQILMPAWTSLPAEVSEHKGDLHVEDLTLFAFPPLPLYLTVPRWWGAKPGFATRCLGIHRGGPAGAQPR